MSWCAGFNASFWSGYFEVAPKAPLFEKRRDLYTLYHILNVRLGAAASRLLCMGLAARCCVPLCDAV